MHHKIYMQIFSCFGETIKKKKSLFVVLLLLTILVIVLAVFSAININNGIFNIDLSNIAYIKFLQGKAGLPAFIFNCIMSIGIVYAIILLTFIKPYTSCLGFIFFLYFVYSQTVIFVSIILIYGFFNVLIILILLLILLLLEFLLLMFVILELANLTNSTCYFKDCFNFQTSKLLLYSIILLCLIVAFCLVTMIFKSFVVLLVY